MTLDPLRVEGDPRDASGFLATSTLAALSMHERVLILLANGHFVQKLAILEDLFGRAVRDNFEAQASAGGRSENMPQQDTQFF